MRNSSVVHYHINIVLWQCCLSVCLSVHHTRGCRCIIEETTIDLTTTGDTDIDRAVAESLRDVPGSGIFGGQVTQEEEQISKFVLYCE